MFGDMCTFLPEKRVGRGRRESDGTLTAGFAGHQGRAINPTREARGPRRVGRMFIGIRFFGQVRAGEMPITGGRGGSTRLMPSVTPYVRGGWARASNDEARPYQNYRANDERLRP